MYIYIYEYIHVYVYIYTYIYTNMCVCVSSSDMPCVMSHVAMYIYVSVCTGWRRLIGSPKLQIIFHKRATKYRALFRKMTYKDKGSYESSPPCICYSSDVPCVMSHVRMYIYVSVCMRFFT